MASLLLFTSVFLSFAFLVYGLNTLHLTFRSKRYSPVSSGPLTTKPSVAIHLPIYNELYVVGRLLDSCTEAARKYGIDRVRIYVLDDSIDETSPEIDRLVSDYLSKGFNFKIIRRGSRQGFKAGALQAALEQTYEEYIAVFDADFILPGDFLEKTVAVLESDPTIGFVQARWGHVDREHNTVTKSVAIGVDAHFLLEQRGRYGSGYLMNFNGSAGVLRASAIRGAGGWEPDTLAEDLDLSYRIQLSAMKAVYLNELEVKGEVPPTIASFKRQQGRWAKGSLQTAKKLLGRIRRSDRLSVGQKLEAAIHLTYYLVHPLMVASFLLAVAADFLSIDVIKYAVNISLPVIGSGSSFANEAYMSFQFAPWIVFSVLVALSTFAVLLCCIEAVRVQHLGLLENFKQIIMLVVIGYGVSISNTVQALGGLLSGQTGAFSRTPKYAIESSDNSWRDKKYQIPFDRTSLLEGGAVALAAAAIAYGYLTSNFGILPILVIYLIGYTYVLGLTLTQTLRSRGAADL